MFEHISQTISSHQGYRLIPESHLFEDENFKILITNTKHYLTFTFIVIQIVWLLQNNFQIEHWFQLCNGIRQIRYDTFASTEIWPIFFFAQYLQVA
jgi:hypothetical protein